MTKPLIIGQAPSRRSDPSEPLSGNSGRRLAGLCGIDLATFLVRFDRINLIPAFPGAAEKGDRFVGAKEARALADALRPAIRGRRVVLLGFQVGAAFRFTGPAFAWERSLETEAVAMSPHPSGISLWWNDRWNAERARRFWSTLARGLDP